MRLFLWLCLAFAIAVPAGTVSHECGHWLAARALGFRPALHYASCDWGTGPAVRAFMEWADAHPGADSAEYKQRVKQAYEQDFTPAKDALVTVAGPLQTILTGLLGVAVLEVRRRRRKQRGESPAKVRNNAADWLWVMVAFFLSREVLNPLSWLAMTAMGHPRPAHPRGDEPRLEELLELPQWSIGLTLAAFAGLVLLAVMRRHIPHRERGVFLLAGVVGGAVGVGVWFWWLGPALMP